MLNELIQATGTPGTVSQFSVMGQVGCLDGDCATIVTNTARLDADDSLLVSGSPAMASFNVSCMGEEPEIEVGDFCTHTQSDWGSVPNGSNVGTLLRLGFGILFPK